MSDHMYQQICEPSFREMKSNIRDIDHRTQKIEQKLNNGINERLDSMQCALERIEKKQDKSDNRVWWIVGLFVAASVGQIALKFFG